MSRSGLWSWCQQTLSRFSTKLACDQEAVADLGGEVRVGAIVTVVDTLEDCYVVVKVGDRADMWQKLPIVLAAFFPDREYDDWRHVDALPSRPLLDGEIAHRMELDHAA